MKAMKKLIPSIIMVLISAMMLSTASFAWFSMNKTVTATGMSVKAQAPATLLIDTVDTTDSNGKLANGGVAKDVAMAEASGINPTSTVDGINWYTALASKENVKDAKKGTVAKVAEDKLNNYRLATTFYLQQYKNDEKAGDASSNKLFIDAITVSHAGSTDPNDNLSSCFRVMVVIGDKIVVCAPTTTTTPTDKGISAISGDGEAQTVTYDNITYTAVSKIESYVATLAENVLVGDMEYNTVYEAKVYIYFDGEDTQCFTDNIPKALNDYTVTVSFSIEENN